MERPSPTEQRSERGLGADQAARLAALNARRTGSAASRAPRRGVQPPTQRDALNARLDALANRRSLPPPSARAGASTPNHARPRSRRRHPAQGARAAALGLSLASTGALAALFAVTGGNPSAGNQVAAASIVASPRPATALVPGSAGATSMACRTSVDDATRGRGDRRGRRRRGLPQQVG